MLGLCPHTLLGNLSHIHDIKYHPYGGDSFRNYGLHFSLKKQLKFNMAKTESLLLPSPKITILQAFHINEQYQPVPQAKIHVTLILLALASYIYSFLLSPCPISIQFLLLPLSKTSLNLACYHKNLLTFHFIPKIFHTADTILF